MSTTTLPHFEDVALAAVSAANTTSNVRGEAMAKKGGKKAVDDKDAEIAKLQGTSFVTITDV